MIKDRTIAGLMIRKAVENGAKLIVINPCFHKLMNGLTKQFVLTNTVLFLKEISQGIDRPVVLHFEKQQTDLML